MAWLSILFPLEDMVEIDLLDRATPAGIPGIMAGNFLSQAAQKVEQDHSCIHTSVPSEATPAGTRTAKLFVASHRSSNLQADAAAEKAEVAVPQDGRLDSPAHRWPCAGRSAAAGKEEEGRCACCPAEELSLPLAERAALFLLSLEEPLGLFGGVPAQVAGSEGFATFPYNGKTSELASARGRGD